MAHIHVLFFLYRCCSHVVGFTSISSSSKLHIDEKGKKKKSNYGDSLFLDDKLEFNQSSGSFL
jgi:hypothetical protein